MSEQEFNKQVQDMIEAHGGYTIKTIVTNRAGVSDVLACINGRFCSLEGKVGSNTASEMQKAHQLKVIKAGGLALTVETLADVLQMIAWAKTNYKQTTKDIPTLKQFSL